MNVLSLFSGIGGLDLGLERAGMTIVGQVEIDPRCRRVLAKHWPEVPRHDDVRTCAEWWGRRPVDLVAGGFPCQPVSAAGKRRAQADERWLWPAMAETVRRLRPAFVLVENVPGLLSAGMGDVLGDLAACGYDAEWDCVSASAVGAPHRRDRVWIVAYPNSGRLEVGAELNGNPASATANGHSRREHADRLRDALADTSRQGLAQREGQPRDAAPQLTAVERSGDSTRDLADAPGKRRGEGPRIFRRVGPPRCGRWAPEPGVGRVAHGVPARVDRLRGLGNAVVPQVAEHIGRLIMEAAS